MLSSFLCVYFCFLDDGKPIYALSCEVSVVSLRLAFVVAKREDPEIDKLHGEHSKMLEKLGQ